MIIQFILRAFPFKRFLLAVKSEIMLLEIVFESQETPFFGSASRFNKKSIRYKVLKKNSIKMDESLKRSSQASGKPNLWLSQIYRAKINQHAFHYSKDHF